MPSNDVSQTSAPGFVVPPCTNCQHSDQVREIAIHDLSPGIQYWRCDSCGFVWATHDGEDLRAAAG
jgi:transposase-like protein